MEDKVTRPNYSILPNRLLSVIGLESSGTQFVTKLIQDAVNSNSVYMEGHVPCKPLCKDALLCGGANLIARKHTCNQENEVQVQHFSLPWVGICTELTDPPVIDAVLPHQCTRNQNSSTEMEECNSISKNAWGIKLNGKPKFYPGRYQLDIVASKNWYNVQGVDQVLVIVVREHNISYMNQTRRHLKDAMLTTKEEEVETEIILDTINNFILSNHEEKVSKTTY